MNKLAELLEFISSQHVINDKDKLTKLIVEKFGITKDSKVITPQLCKCGARPVCTNLMSSGNVVYCPRCKARSKTKPKPAQAIEDWNRRALKSGDK